MVATRATERRCRCGNGSPPQRTAPRGSGGGAGGGRGAEHETYDARDRRLLHLGRGRRLCLRWPRRRDPLWLAAQSMVGRPWEMVESSALSFLTAQALESKDRRRRRKEEQEVLARFGLKPRPKGLPMFCPRQGGGRGRRGGSSTSLVLLVCLGVA